MLMLLQKLKGSGDKGQQKTVGPQVDSSMIQLRFRLDSQYRSPKALPFIQHGTKCILMFFRQQGRRRHKANTRSLFGYNF